MPLARDESSDGASSRASIPRRATLEALDSLPYLSTSYSLERKPRNEYPLQLVRYLVRTHRLRPGRLLDVGTGRGDWLEVFSALGFDVIGVDVSKESGIYVHPSQLRQVNLIADELPFEAESFDYIFCKSVIEHLPLDTHLHVFPELHRVLKPGGLAIFLTVDWYYIHQHFFEEYTHVHPWTQQSLSDCLTIYGFESVAVQRLVQLPAFFKWPRLVWAFSALIRWLCIPSYWKFSKYSHHIMLVAAARRPETASTVIEQDGDRSLKTEGPAAA